MFEIKLNSKLQVRFKAIGSFRIVKVSHIDYSIYFSDREIINGILSVDLHSINSYYFDIRRYKRSINYSLYKAIDNLNKYSFPSYHYDRGEHQYESGDFIEDCVYYDQFSYNVINILRKKYI